MPNKNLHIDESLKRIEYTFQWSGIYLETNNRTAAQKKMIKLRYIINFLSTNTLFIASVACCLKGIADGIDLTEVTRVACANIFGFLIDVKSASFLIHENSINELMAALKNLENEEHDRERPDEINKMIKGEIGFLNKVLNVYIIGMGINVAYFLGQPAFAVAVNFFTNHELKLFLPMNLVFPFDPYDIRYWPFFYVHQIFSVSVAGLQVIAADCLFFICCTYLRTSFITLGYDFEEIIEKSYINSQFQATTVDDEIRNRLESLVKRHQHISKAVSILEKIYAATNLSSFLASSLVICLNAFNVTQLNNFSLAMYFVVFLFVALSQIFFICYFADMLIDQSMRVSDAVYNCNWYLAKKSIVKSLQFVHHRAQIPCKITAYGYVDVNLLAFSKIMSTSWSYFTLLSAVYSEGEK